MIKRVDTDQWKLSIRIEYVPKNPDKKIGCNVCRSTGTDFYGEGGCLSCGGNGFKYTRNTTEPQPALPEGLSYSIRTAYNKWLNDDNTNP